MQNTDESSDNAQHYNLLVRMIEKMPTFSSVLFLVVFHFIAVMIVASLYGMASLGSLTYYCGLVIFEIAFFITYTKRNLLLSIVLPFFLFPLFVVILYPAFYVIYMMPKLLVYGLGAVSLGIVFGLFAKQVVKFQTRNFVLIAIIIAFLINIFTLKFFVADALTCDKRPNQQEADFCYKEMAEKKEDPTLCSNVQDIEDRRSCYYWVLIGYEDEPSMDSCDVIPDKNDREHCYGRAARETKNGEICKQLENKQLARQCTREVEIALCSDLSAGEEKGNCVRAVDAKYPSQTDSSTATNVNSGSQTMQSIKDNVNYAQKLAKTCALNEGGVVLSGKKGGDPICKGYDFGGWPTITGCGSNAFDTKWPVVYRNGEWDFTIECTNVPGCSGIENVKCTKEGCVFSKNCQQ